MKILAEAVQVIGSLQKTKVSLSKVSQYDRKDENSAIAKILQEINVIKATISQTKALVRRNGRSWAQVASKEETTGTVIRIQDDKKKKK
ncbi:hypothetical protein K3495_g16817 [Podosphaera aphanis]|nr:hypothetical protein K3495_g16817 [Podosphaera aphanis]